MLQFSGFFVLYIVGVLVGITEAKIHVTIHNVTGNPNPDYVTLAVSTRNTLNGPVVDIDSNLKSDLDSNLLLWIDLQAKNEFSGYETLFKSDNLELCILLDSAKEHTLASQFLESIYKHGNLPRGCPVKKDHFYLKAYQLDADLLPSYCPSGNFRVIFGVTYLTPKNVTEKLFDMSWDIEITNDMQIL